MVTMTIIVALFGIEYLIIDVGGTKCKIISLKLWNWLSN
jgi:hypothetical protein